MRPCLALAIFALIGLSSFAVASDRARIAAGDAADLFDCVIEPSAVIEVGSAAKGLLAWISVDRSDVVEAGQLIAQLESDVEFAAVELMRARSEMQGEIRARHAADQYGQRAAERRQELFDEKIVSLDTVDQAKLEARVAAARLEEAHDNHRIAELELKRAEAALAQRTIRSPVTGVVVDRMVSPGELVDEDPLLEIAQIDPLRVEAIMPAERYGSILPGMQVEVFPESPNHERRAAEVVVVDRMIDAASGTFRVRADLPNPDLAMPGGLRCKVSFHPSSSVVVSSPNP